MVSSHPPSAFTPLRRPARVLRCHSKTVDDLMSVLYALDQPGLCAHQLTEVLRAQGLNSITVRLTCLALGRDFFDLCS